MNGERNPAGRAAGVDGAPARRGTAAEGPSRSWVDSLAAPGASGPEDGAPRPFGGARYRLADLLGAGGMGVVFRAEDLQLEREVAVKALRPEYKDDASLRRRFVGEALILASIEHPGSVPIHEAATLGDGEPFYSMKRLTGVTLRELLARRTREEVLSREGLAHFVDVFERVCEAVAAAHARGIVHRDLKPENVMVDDLGSVYVLDWGIAAKLGQGEPGDRWPRVVQGELCGTPGHMAPEQLLGTAAQIGTASDVFGLGVILYEVLTGERPFEAKDADAMASLTLARVPADPRRKNRHAGRSLAAVCRRCLAKSPGDRYPSARELCAEVRRWRELRPVEAAPPTAPERVLKWLRRHPAVASALGTAAAIVLVTVGLASARAGMRRRLVTEANALSRGLRDEVTRIDAEVGRLEKAGPVAAPAVSGRIGERLDELRALKEADEARIVSMAWAVAGLTLGAPDPGALALLRLDLRRRVSRALEEDRPLTAVAAARQGLRGAGRQNALQLTPADVAWLRSRLAEAEAAARRKGIEIERVLPEVPAASP